MRTNFRATRSRFVRMILRFPYRSCTYRVNVSAPMIEDSDDFMHAIAVTIVRFHEWRYLGVDAM